MLKLTGIPGAIFGLCVIRPRRYLTVSVDRPNPNDATKMPRTPSGIYVEFADFRGACHEIDIASANGGGPCSMSLPLSFCF